MSDSARNKMGLGGTGDDISLWQAGDPEFQPKVKEGEK